VAGLTKYMKNIYIYKCERKSTDNFPDTSRPQSRSSRLIMSQSNKQKKPVSYKVSIPYM